MLALYATHDWTQKNANSEENEKKLVGFSQALGTAFKKATKRTRQTMDLPTPKIKKSLYTQTLVEAFSHSKVTKEDREMTKLLPRIELLTFFETAIAHAREARNSLLIQFPCLKEEQLVFVDKGLSPNLVSIVVYDNLKKHFWTDSYSASSNPTMTPNAFSEIAPRAACVLFLNYFYDKIVSEIDLSKLSPAIDGIIIGAASSYGILTLPLPKTHHRFFQKKVEVPTPAVPLYLQGIPLTCSVAFMKANSCSNLTDSAYILLDHNSVWLYEPDPTFNTMLMTYDYEVSRLNQWARLATNIVNLYHSFPLIYKTNAFANSAK